MDYSHDDLKKSILSLLKLQDIDGSLFKLTEEENKKPADLTELEAQDENLKKIVAAADRSFRQVERERRSFELRYITLTEDVKRSEQKRKEVRNTKEEFSANREFENFQKKVADLKKLMEEKTAESEERQKVLQEKQAELDSLQSKLGELQATRNSRLEEIKSDKASLLEKRQGYITEANDEIFSMYERVQKLRRGTGVALVESGMCNGCFVSLPPQLSSQLQRLEKLVTCPSCSRILFPSNMLETLNTTAELEKNSDESSEEPVSTGELKSSNA